MRYTILMLIFAAWAVLPVRAERPLREAQSEDGGFRLLIRPGNPSRPDQPCQASLFDNRAPGSNEAPSQRGRSAAEGREGDANPEAASARATPSATAGSSANRAFDRRDPGKLLWQRPFVNDVAPAQVFIRKDGRFIVTLDEFRRGGARHALVIYGARGELLRHFMLTDLLEEVDWRQVKAGARLVSWLDRAKAAFDDQYNEFVVTLGSGRRVRIDLRTLQVIRPGARSLAELGVSRDVLGALFDQGSDGTPSTSATQAAAVAAEGPLDFEAADYPPPASLAELARRQALAVAPPEEVASSDAASGPDDPDMTDPTAITVPEPDSATIVDYLGWLNEQGVVDGPDAAPVYHEAIAAAVAWPGTSGLYDAAEAGDPQALQSPEIAAWLEANRAALSRFREATLLGARGWHYESVDGSLAGMTLPDLAPLRQLARVNVMAGRRELLSGRPAEAANHFLDTLAAGAHLGNGLTMIENLVGAAVQTHAAEALLDLQADPRAAQLDFDALADDVVAAARPLRPAVDGVQGERAMFLDTAQRLWKLDQQSGERVLDPEAVRTMMGFMAEDPAELARVTEQLERNGFAQTIEEGRLYYDALAAAMSQPYPVAQRQLAELENIVAQSDSANPILKQLSPAVSRFNMLRTRAEATRRAALVVTRIRAYEQQHGAPPESLEALGLGDVATDPFTGATFQYRREGADFVLSSPGAAPAAAASPAGQELVEEIRYWPRPPRK